jgi:hypothetical protein
VKTLIRVAIGACSWIVVIVGPLRVVRNLTIHRNMM